MCTRLPNINKSWAKKYRKLSQNWCPHPDCQVHVCDEHRFIVHDFKVKEKRGINIRSYNTREKKVQRSLDTAGTQTGNSTSGSCLKNRKQKKK